LTRNLQKPTEFLASFPSSKSLRISHLNYPILYAKITQILLPICYVFNALCTPLSCSFDNSNDNGNTYLVILNHEEMGKKRGYWMKLKL